MKVSGKALAAGISRQVHPRLAAHTFALVAGFTHLNNRERHQDV